MRRSLFAILVLLSMAGCGLKNNDEIPVINVAEALGTYRAVPMSELIAKLEYVPLETGGDFLVGRINNLIVTADRIFVSGPNYCYAFTREGKFITNIGRVGRGPGEYNRVSGVSIDENRGTIYLENYRDLLEYRFDGTFVRSFAKPASEGEDPVIVGEIICLSDNMFLGHINNGSGSEPHNWMIFDDIGKVFKKFDNHIRIGKEDFAATIFRSTPVYTSGEVYVKEYLNDTIYHLDAARDLSAAFIFDLGRYAFPLDAFIPFDHEEIRTSSVMVAFPGTGGLQIAADKIFFTSFVGNKTGVETPEGVTSTTSVMGRQVTGSDRGVVPGIYDMASGRTKLLDRDPLTRRLGLVNDIDGGLSFWPRTVSSDGGLVDIWESFEMKDMLDEEYFGAHKIGDPAANERLRKLLEGLEYDDNPVIVIAKLKK